MIDLKIKSMFFDRPKVQRAVNRSKRKVLSKAGAFIRTSARSSIRPRKGTSSPGQPPFSHEGSLRRLILFGYDAKSDSVVVGPVGFKQSTAPRALETGSTTTIYHRRKGKLVSQKVRIASRPFMMPALRREQSKLPPLWRNSVRGA
jgi:hypothetical protein